jgi:proteasome lid subunit RPN8/RPN11
MEKVVHIKERAFLSIVLSAVEVYKHETIGLLLGYRGIDKFFVEYAIPYQTAVKGYAWAMPPEKATERMTKILKNMAIDVIGDYHSHTEFGEMKARPIPSGDDIADMIQGRVHIIIAVNDKERKARWHHNRDGSISGTLGNYWLKIASAEAYGNYRYKRVKIICPSATGIEI